MITPEELDYIRTAAIGDMLGDSKALDTGEAINLAEARSLAQEHERLVSRRVTRK